MPRRTVINEQALHFLTMTTVGWIITLLDLPTDDVGLVY